MGIKMRIFSLLLLTTILLSSCKDQTIEPVELPEYETYTIRGQITDQDGNPFPDASVTLFGNYSPADAGIDSSANYYYTGLRSAWYIIQAVYNDIPQTYAADTIFALVQDTTVNLQIVIMEDKKYSGIVYDMFGNGVSDIEVIFSYNIDNETVNRFTNTNSTGYFEFIEYMNWETDWEIKINNSDYRLYSKNNRNKSIISSTDQIRFNELSPIIYEWETTEDGVSKFYQNNDIAKASLIITGESFTLNLITAQNQIFTPFNKASFTSKVYQNGTIHKIGVEAATQSTFTGIYSVDDLKNPTLLKLEFGSTSGPSVEGGFGSSNGGANGTDHIWEFKRK